MLPQAPSREAIEGASALMPFLFERLLYQLQPRPLHAAAVKVTTLHPSSEDTAKSSLHLPGDFENIISVIPASKLELERGRTFGEKHRHHPTIQYELKNARIAGKYVASRGRIGRYPTNRPTDNAPDIGHLKEALLSTNVLSGKEFGHWVRDSLISEMQGNSLGLPSIGLARELWEHEPGYRHLSGLECDYVGEARVDRLVFIDDRGLNAHWADRFMKLRGRMKQNIDHSIPSAGPLVFLDRGGQSRPRDPANLAAVRDALEAIGFRTITAIDMSVEEIGSALRDTKLVVSPEGSHLNHMHFFGGDGTTVITLQDPRRYYSFHKRLIDIYGNQFGFLIGRPDPEAEGRFYIDIDDLKRLIDLAR